MWKFFAVLIVFIFTSKPGDGLECYHCEDCTTDAASYEKVTCENDEICVTKKTTQWLIGERAEEISKGCATSIRLCDEENAKEQAEAEKIRKGGDYIADYEPQEFECAFCNTTLCNDSKHKIPEAS